MSEIIAEIARNPLGAIQMVRKTLTKLGWGEMRPWSEFVAEFKQPSNLEDRLTTNFLYYRSNYVAVVAASLLFSVATSPSSLFLALMGLLASALTLVLAQNSSAAAGVLCLTSFLTGTRLALGLLLGLVLILLHMLFRTRSIKSRMSAAYDEHTKM